MESSFFKSKAFGAVLIAIWLYIIYVGAIYFALGFARVFSAPDAILSPCFSLDFAKILSIWAVILQTEGLVRFLCAFVILGVVVFFIKDISAFIHRFVDKAVEKEEKKSLLASMLFSFVILLFFIFDVVNSTPDTGIEEIRHKISNYTVIIIAILIILSEIISLIRHNISYIYILLVSLLFMFYIPSYADRLGALVRDQHYSYIYGDLESDNHKLHVIETPCYKYPFDKRKVENAEVD